MKRSSHGAGALREKLAVKELKRARKIADEDGLAELLEHAMRLDAQCIREEQRLPALVDALEREPKRRAALVENHLRETVHDRKALRADRRELRRGRPHRLTIAALAERSSAFVFRTEVACESALAVLRGRLREAEALTLSVAHLNHLAVRPGRWSRRVEALAVLRSLARYPMRTADRALVVETCRELSRQVHHRWVQTPAFEVLARVEPELALANMCERFCPPFAEDDFLIRERLVELAARLRRTFWHVVIELGADDPSEHVRITAARVERDAIGLRHLATEASSDKVRATALWALAKRAPDVAGPTLATALERDASPLAVTTAAAAFTLLARRKTLHSRKSAHQALTRAAMRTSLPEHTRVAVAEELLSVAVLADPYLRLVYDLLSKVVTQTKTGGGVRVTGKVLAAVTDAQMGQVLSALARDDFALSADRVGDSFIVYRAERREFALWRWLFELRHPLPSKRQGYTHTWGRAMRGRLRAPPRGLAELTATSVPGERVLVAKRRDWGRQVPLVDDLLHTGLFAHLPTHIVGSTGTTVITPPDSFARRAKAWLRLSVHYARFAETRRRSLESEEAAIQTGFLEAIARETGFQMTFHPHGFCAELPAPPELTSKRSANPLGVAPAEALAVVPLAQTVDGVVRDFLHYAVRPEGNRLPHVGAYAAALLVTMVARSVVTRRRIDADRKGIPLVIGGWGTRGKSGTERLKAGLFHGLGYEVLVKTTGCEAMFIHAVPGLPAHEVFIYRPYDKATIWEQRGVLELGRRFGVQVFLWECMALQPDLVNLLSAQWMRDDYSTITNAYPDHEDVQGPAGYDVAEVISEFIPPKGRLFTTEDQMLPLLREAAKGRGTSMRAIDEREASLLGEDILARFPYHEHPKNIALVCAVAQALGVPAAVALAEMADNVVPDLGVLKTYPTIDHAGRTLAFTNGMSANERTGALSNWVRMGFDRHDVEHEPARWVVTVVNNRADRVARSEVFARLLIQDVSAHKHFLIGTNVSGLLVFLRDALEKHLVAIAPTRDLGRDSSSHRAIVLSRLELAFSRLKIGHVTSASVVAELTAFGLPALGEVAFNALLEPAKEAETFAEASRAVDGALPQDYSPEARPFVVATIVRRRLKRSILAAVEAHLTTRPALVSKVFSDAYRAMVEDQFVVLHDASLRGDKLIELVAKGAPPGAHVDIMGLQNIKGTGLDFVYRWVSLEAVERALTKAKSNRADDVDAGLRALLVHDDYGFFDSTYALRVVETLRPTAEPALKARLDAVTARLTPIASMRKAALEAKRSRSFGDVVRGVFGKTFDYLDSMRRQAMARAVLDDLVAGRVSHAGAAVEMRDVVGRAKGAWAAKKSRDCP